MKVNGEKIALWTTGLILTAIGILLIAGMGSEVYLGWAKAIAAAKTYK